MSEDIEETLKQRVKKSPAYAIMTDEATDISNKKHLAFCAKYVDEAGEIKVDFIKDVRVDNGKAETIFKETVELVQDEIRVDNFVAFGSDGCNTMIGKKSGVTTRLKEVKPELVTVHCHNHRLALAAKDSFQSLKEFQETDEVLSSVHKYYKSSSNRTTSLEKLQNVLEDCDTKRVKQVAHTRWLSHYDAVTSLKDTYAAVIMDLENAVESGNDKVRIGSGPSASGLAKKLKSYQTVHIIHFLCDALKPLTQLALTFETNNIDLSVIKPKMDSTVSALKKLKTSPGVSLRKASKLMDDFEISPTEQKRSVVHAAENKFIDNLIDNIESRLQNSDIIDAMSIFNMSGKGSFDGNDEIELLAEHFSEDVDSALYEWDSLKDCVAELDPVVKNSPSALLKTLMTVSPTTGNTYPVVTKLCSTAAVLPVSTAEVERVFSSVNRIVTDLRNRLSVENTNKLLHVIKNDQYINYQAVVKRWLKAKPRRI
ncbi:zinc finger protein 862-like [Mercenaria mercenaria]|uniref:zinc finger protein 862-like n=1 Tax=Mercenaria mercenaria TaxID=6596 RepID=UPI00234E391E|nr:zinc finger protein 862-like [Mercenaria mercenaria]